VLVALPLGCGSGAESFRWRTALPSSQGLDADALEAWANGLEAAGTRSLLLIRNDRIVVERHAEERNRETAHAAASLAKGIVGGLGLALLLEAGQLDLDDPVATHLARWKAEPRKSEITLRQLATHMSGLEEAKVPGIPKSQLTGWKRWFWDRTSERNPVELALDDAQVLRAPGEAFEYSSPGFAVLSAALASAADGSLRSLLRGRIFEPLGLEDDSWSIGYGAPFAVNGREVWATWGGAEFTPDGLARVGRLLLRRGDWEGKPLIHPAALEAMITATPRPSGVASDWPAAAIGWWTNARGLWPELPRDTFLAAGARHQILLVVPSWDLVVVRVGESLGRARWGGDYWSALHETMLRPLARAFPVPPVPRSDVIAGAWFAPLSSVVCVAHGSDNWPLTWGPGEALTTAYGDGHGFEPYIAEKLSNGFARVTGEPPDFVGKNFRAPSGEQKGDGRSGGKASGLLAVDGVLYMLVRNLDNTRLAWSEDRGNSWSWGFTFETSFGSASFLQFGRNYAGARDDYVYAFSQDGPSAYEASDQLVLARAPRDRIREREAWQFFGGLGPDGAPRFSATIEQRKGVFAYPGRVKRSEVVYDADLGRYLMALGYDHEGGWGLYEAPEPWGPWRSVYHTTRWDVGRTHSYRLPTAWIRDGGRTLHLVYSGKDGPDRIRDGFCVRRVRLGPLEAEPFRASERTPARS
jgi:CubicO group peptidase (beta-lactamase class C family)